MMGDLAELDPEAVARARAAASNMSIQPPEYDQYPLGGPSDPGWAMGAIAAQDTYQPLGNDPWTGLMRGQRDLPLSDPSMIPADIATNAAGIPRRAIEAAQTYRQTGEYDPGPILEAAMLPMGTGAIAGVPVRGMEAVFGAGPIRAYHGSPHNFEKFDVSKIGTGEGAQAYGHGLYFAENEGVARGYRERLSANAPYLRNGQQVLHPELYGAMENAALSTGIHPDQAGQVTRQILKLIEKEGSSAKVYGSYEAPAGFERAWDAALDTARDIKWNTNPGRMYEVNINDDPAHFLDWDKPLAQQRAGALLPPEMIDQAKREAYNRAIASTSRTRADELYGMVKDPMQAPGGFVVEAGKYMRSPEISAQMNERGIPGIKYLDQGSRAGGFPTAIEAVGDKWRVSLKDPQNITTRHMFDSEAAARAFAKTQENPTSNYVVFNPAIIDILRKYGLAGAAPVGMGALAAQDQYNAP